jgi:hypothetical protein
MKNLRMQIAASINNGAKKKKQEEEQQQLLEHEQRDVLISKYRIAISLLKMNVEIGANV